MKKMTVMTALIILATALLVSCQEKMETNFPAAGGVNPQNVTLKGGHYNNEKTLESNSSSDIQTNMAATFSLQPAEAPTIARGFFSILINGEEFLQNDQMGETNGIVCIFAEPTNAILNVAGTSFAFNNIALNVTGGTQPPVDSTPATSPVKIKKMTIASGMVAVNIATALEGQGHTIGGTGWKVIQRVSGQNFSNVVDATTSVDTVSGVITFSAINNSWVEFSFGCNIATKKNEDTDYDFIMGNPKKVFIHSEGYRISSSHREEMNAEKGEKALQWLDPGVMIGGFYSSLYTYQYTNNAHIPYQYSSSYFGFKYVDNYQGHPALLDYMGRLVYSLGGTNPPNQIPGEYGDNINKNYRVRKTGTTYWVKTNDTNFMIKIGEEGTWVSKETTIEPSNNDYRKMIIDPQTEGRIYFKWGAGSGTSFLANNNEITSSSFYYLEGTSACCADQSHTIETP